MKHKAVIIHSGSSTSRKTAPSCQKHVLLGDSCVLSPVSCIYTVYKQPSRFSIKYKAALVLHVEEHQIEPRQVQEVVHLSNAEEEMGVRQDATV